MNKQVVAFTISALILGASSGYWFARQAPIEQAVAINNTLEAQPLYYRNPMNPEITSPVPAQDSMGMDYIPVYAEEEKTKTEPEVLFYRNPMNPEITSPVPAQDSMGMDYIPVYADGGPSTDEPSGTVTIDPVTIQNIGVRTEIAKTQTLSRSVRTVGRVVYNEERLARLHPKTEGWIEKLHIDKTGEQVKKGSILLSVYSPQLVASQQEYLLALNNLNVLKNSPFKDISNSAEELVKTSRERLELLDVPAHQIKELEKTRKIKKQLHIHSPFSGIVINIGAREGQHISPGTELYMLADLSKVWVYADIYEYELPWVKDGDLVEMQLEGIPGRTFTGRLAYIYPYAEAKTRTVKVRLEFDNPDMLLKPDMFAEITIQAQRQEQAVTIPAEAVVRSGERNQVFVVRDQGKFEPRLVKLGLTDQGRVQVLDGVAAGETVVTSSQFLIDSESKLREATAKMMDAMSADSPADRSAFKSSAGMDMSTMSHAAGEADDLNMEHLSLDGSAAQQGEHQHD